MYKDYRYINAGTNEIHRYGHKSVERVLSYLEPHNGYISIPVDGGRHYTIGTSSGKYGEFCKINNTIFSVNGGGFAYAKADTEKGQKLIDGIKSLAEEMNRINAQRVADIESDEEE